MIADKFCADCVYFDDDTMQCKHEHGLLKGIEQSESMSNASHTCRSFEERVYRLSPASLLNAAMLENDVKTDFKTVVRIFDSFMQMMEEHE